MARSSHSPTITAGFLRGRRLEVPAGRSVRPTRSMVRQALFNLLGEAIEDARVLDLYSGSGALGLEALSRGARTVVMVEKRPATLAVLRRNLATCGVHDDQVRLVPGDARRLDPLPLGPFEVVLADPPFADRDSLPPGLGQAVVPGAWLAFHAPIEAPPPALPAPWALDRSRSYGRSAIHLLRHGPA